MAIHLRGDEIYLLKTPIICKFGQSQQILLRFWNKNVCNLTQVKFPVDVWRALLKEGDKKNFGRKNAVHDAIFEKKAVDDDFLLFLV